MLFTRKLKQLQCSTKSSAARIHQAAQQFRRGIPQLRSRRLSILKSFFPLDNHTVQIDAGLEQFAE